MTNPPPAPTSPAVVPTEADRECARQSVAEVLGKEEAAWEPVTCLIAAHRVAAVAEALAQERRYSQALRNALGWYANPNAWMDEAGRAPAVNALAKTSADFAAPTLPQAMRKLETARLDKIMLDACKPEPGSTQLAPAMNGEPSRIARGITGEFIACPVRDGKLPPEGIRMAHIVDRHLKPLRQQVDDLRAMVFRLLHDSGDCGSMQLFHAARREAVALLERIKP